MKQLHETNTNLTMACSASPSERTVYVVVAVVMAAFGVSFLAESIFMGIVGLLLAVVAAIMAVTGFCPPDWLALRTRNDHNQHLETLLGFAVAPNLITLQERPYT